MIDTSLAINHAPGIKAELPSDLKGACKAMEQEFMQLVLSSMRKAMMKTEAKGSVGFSQDVAYSMMDTEVARMTTDGEGMGLWKAMYDQLAPAGAEVKSEKSSVEKKPEGIVKRMPYIIG